MKKNYLLKLLCVSFFFMQCGKSENVNSGITNSTPTSPTNLTSQTISSSKITLNWIDNSTDEFGFKLERKNGTTPYTVIYTSIPNLTSYVDSNLLSSTNYTYRVYSYKGSNNSNYSNETSSITSVVLSIPLLLTTQPSSITASGAVSGGNISNDGGSTITSRGVVWNTSTNPTIALPTKTDSRTDGNGPGIFVSSLTFLKSNTEYYIKAYAINSTGLAYGNEIKFTTSSGAGGNASCGAKDVHSLISTYGTLVDIDGNTYKSIKIGNQEWMAENLKTSRFRNGSPIAVVSTVSLIDGAASIWPNYDSVNYSCPYGKVYTQWVALDNRKACPVGWHMPDELEWDTLVNYIGGYNQATLKHLSSAGPTYWSNSADNTSGFSALPGGSRNVSGVFGGLGLGTMFWTSTSTTTLGVQIGLNSDAGTVGIGKLLNNREQAGYIRCIKDK
jgi:uncharacterized protein (TIGR02145 family)